MGKKFVQTHSLHVSSSHSTLRLSDSFVFNVFGSQPSPVLSSFSNLSLFLSSSVLVSVSHSCCFFSAGLPVRPFLARLLRTVDGSTRVPRVTASSDVMSLLDIFWLRREVMCCSSAPLSFRGRPLRLRSSIRPVFLCFCRRACTAPLEMPVCFEIFAWERPCWRRFTTLSRVSKLTRAIMPGKHWTVLRKTSHLIPAERMGTMTTMEAGGRASRGGPTQNKAGRRSNPEQK